MLRDHAKERRIAFTISFEEFERFAEQTNYIAKMGNQPESLTIDRKDNLKGYVPGNIQPMTRAKNSEKRHKQDEVRMRKGLAWLNGARDIPLDYDEAIPPERIPF